MIEMADENQDARKASAPGIKVVDEARSDGLLAEARSTARQRTHLLLHDDHSDPVQRLLVAFEHGSYVRPHRHSEQWELILPLRGILRLLVFSPDGVVTRRMDIEPRRTDVVEVPAGAWHTLVAVTPSALMLEVKPGPYRPAEFARWAHQEKDPKAAETACWLLDAEVGARPKTY